MMQKKPYRCHSLSRLPAPSGSELMGMPHQLNFSHLIQKVNIDEAYGSLGMKFAEIVCHVEEKNVGEDVTGKLVRHNFRIVEMIQ
eukprot:2969532-Amphidinium_carterae.1